MIEPVAPLAITGAIWYQGEANADRAYQYRGLLPAMIGDWRRVFRQGDFPFYIVSLPAFTPRRAAPGDDNWAELREAQAMTARSVAHSGVAITIDTPTTFTRRTRRSWASGWPSAPSRSTTG
jgi:sialate O-acetylesterase